MPVCQLCSKPIPLKPGEVADDKVGAHIDADCQSDPAKERRKVGWYYVSSSLSGSEL